MKYQSDELGNHLDITTNYNTNKKRVILKQISPYRTDFYRCEDGKIRFLTVRYMNVSYQKSKGKYLIDPTWYKEEKTKKKITDRDQFICSLHRDELIGIVKKDGAKYIYDSSTEGDGVIMLHDGIEYEIVKFTATNDDKQNVIEVKPTYTYCKKQLRVSIGTVKLLKKYATDVLGNLYEVKDNKLKLEFD